MLRNYRIVKTSELREGDIVGEHGMRLLIDRPIEVSKSHPAGQGDAGSVLYTQALVLNIEDVRRDNVVPEGWLADWDYSRRGKELPHDGEYRWTIQGNDRARWAVEHATANQPV